MRNAVKTRKLRQGGVAKLTATVAVQAMNGQAQASTWLTTYFIVSLTGWRVRQGRSQTQFCVRDCHPEIAIPGSAFR